MNVTVFGAASPKPGDKDYEDALWLGEALARAGHTVLNGGYIGTMEAVSRGAFEVGGHVIGVTCTEIEDWRHIGPNPWLTEIRRFATLRERLWGLIEDSDAAIALPGGPGTLAEVGFLWNHIGIEALPPRPLILVGGKWRQTIQTFLNEMSEYVRQADIQRITFVEDVRSVMPILKKSA